ncbi:hypothetical protein [Frigoriglobus tundricola]|uniref:Uncharacterized protein n=1 Tax=Frigoriglobus tundricola TaxID=2774151 RepID=A0A6M5YJZ1_9BACT|nr:hypothetical protein [Frigoriglobus tundricola]QJW94369.1 hypothetical protein FTUN_1889 [Frigoriglobus tundricola]
MALLRQPVFDWRSVANPDVLLNAVWPRPLAYHATTATRDLSPDLVRRLRLYGVACARMVWDVLSTDARNAVLLSERHADGHATAADLRAAAVRMRYGPVTHQQQAANAAGWASAGFWREGGEPAVAAEPSWNPAEAAREAAKALATRAAGPVPTGGNPVATGWQDAWNGTFAEARAHQAELVRDIFPPPGHAPVLWGDWLTSAVTALARQMDETGDFSAVPILADALQDAGCDDDAMLDRCRADAGVHCRGNWVVDLVLGRE